METETRSPSATSSLSLANPLRNMKRGKSGATLNATAAPYSKRPASAAQERGPLNYMQYIRCTSPGAAGEDANEDSIQ